MKKKILIITVLAIITLNLSGKEGMWIPLLIEKNIVEMQSMGFELTAEDIYSINQACMKDAIMLFGRGCTGALISEKGLLITNHHCGFDQIQQHSSVERDYLANGFWAMSNEQELSTNRLKVTFLRSMEDVTDRVLENVTPEMSMNERKEIIRKNIIDIRKTAEENTHFTARIESFYHGNQYFLFLNEEFLDVRLVGAPPSSIGKFGGDSDNWAWPRHTGDFAFFRIYADYDNKPAEYSPNNVPYKSPYFFPISIKGIEEGDFTMVFGYPGSTFQYVPTYHIKMLTELIYPKLIDLRTAKLNVMNKYMQADRAVRIQYAAKNANLANSWKRWKGEIRGLDILDAVNTKNSYENDFFNWTNENEVRKSKYGSILSEYENIYSEYSQYRMMRDYILEYIGRAGLEPLRLSNNFYNLGTLYSITATDSEIFITEKKELYENILSYCKDLHLPVEKETMIVALKMLFETFTPDFFPDIKETIDKKYKGNIDKYIDDVFAKTIFTNETALLKVYENFNNQSVNKLKEDAIFKLYSSIREVNQNKILPRFNELQNKIDSLNRIYMNALLEFDTERVFYPDANLTLRVSYGDVSGYDARDAVYYKHFTTLDGIIEKEDSEIYDYKVPEELKELFRKKNYGIYEVNGTVPVAFVATNHTTGGNSGSPIINACGELIGINFDRAWEGVMSDLMFNPNQCRNISVDIRYALFIIEKFADAGYLLEEMKIVK